MRYNFKEVEEEVLSYWHKHKIYEKAKEKAKGEKFYFLDGPPYTSGRVHIGTAWNKALKDSVLRYRRMKGQKVWDRAGYDMHGLPIENKVQEKLKLKYKEDVESYGMEKFVRECEELSKHNLKLMNQDFQRLGVWMDFDNAYQSITEEFMNGEWWLVKKAHEKNRLYLGFRTMPWCASCQTALAKHELEYKEVQDDSIFLKFPVIGKQNEFLIIWTTTPWTIPFNLAVMVNPEMEYVKAQVDNEVWIIAAPLVGVFISGVVGKQFTILETFKGEKLEGMKYIHPLNDSIPFFASIQDNPKLHTILLSEEYVDASAGTGLVHCAPGCGPEDYEIGYRNKLPPFNELDEAGAFKESMGKYSGWIAKKDDKNFVEELDNSGSLIATTKVDHEYAHCWRCHNPVVYRATEQWFFKVEDMKEKMVEANQSIHWVPEAAFNAFNSWLQNLRDNSVSKQRFWGTALPVWICESCKEKRVFGSKQELEEASKTKVKNMHKPWIDDIIVPCACGSEMKRVPDVLDVWVDAGTSSWNCLDYPDRDDLFKELFPADFILEGKDQIRGWFNLLMVASMIAFDKPSFKAVYMHGFVDDAQGRKMSKSAGNYILPEEVVNQYGADTLRYYTIGGANPGTDLNYNFEDVKLKQKNLDILWNLHNLVMDLAKQLGANPAHIKTVRHGVEEQFILSKLNSTLVVVTEKFEGYLLNEIPLLIEGLFLDLSRTYVQMVREKMATGTDTEKKTILNTLYHVLMEVLKMFTPIAPFITEKIYQEFKAAFDIKEESISLYSWPMPDAALINEDLEKKVEILNVLMQAGLFAREKMQLGVRWPIQEMLIQSDHPLVSHAVSELKDILLTQLNVKEVKVSTSFERIKVIVKANYGPLGIAFKEQAPKIIANLAQESGESIVQHLAKEHKYTLKIDKKPVDILPEHVLIERVIPPDLQEAESRFGVVYLSKTRTKELDAEGFAREIMRRVQETRKKAGLEKRDEIDLGIQVDEEMEQMIKPFKALILDKCGVKKLELGKDIKKHAHVAELDVKGKQIIVSLSKI